MTVISRRGSARALLVLACLLVTPRLVSLVHAQAPAPEMRFKVGDVVITAPWTRQPPDGARVAGGYMRITNTGKTADRLIGGSTVIAKRFEIHEMAMADGVMKMRELAQGLEIKPGETVELKPGGYHIMLMDLQSRPQAGANVAATLKFEKAGDVALDLPVVAAARSGAAASHHKH